MKNVKIIIADDHPVFRHGIHQLLTGHNGFKDVGEASNGKEVLEMLEKDDYNLVIMDIRMPDMGGIEATRRIKKKYPEVRVLALSMYDDHPYILRMLRAGAMGYLLKNSSKEELMTAIEKVMNGENYFSKDVSSIMMQSIIEGKPIPPSHINDPEKIILTKRELEIMHMIAEELTNVEIGKNLNISPRTVDTHRRNLLQKLRVKNTAGLVRYAIRHGLLD